MATDEKSPEAIQSRSVTDGDTDSREDIEAAKPALTDEEKAARIRQEYFDKQLEARLAANVDAPPTNNLSSLWKKNKQDRSPDKIATQPSVFDDPNIGPYFYPGEQYENRHRFDPDFRWTWGEEIPLVKRIDWRIMVWACIAFFSLDLHRKNISQANTDNFLDDLDMDTNDYNTGTTIFRLTFLFAELPSQLISKKLGPDRWIPICICAWSIVGGAQFFLQNSTGFFATRALMGLLQGGVIPDTILYLSYFYKGTELPFRLALYWMANRATDIISPLLAFGILRLRGVGGYEGWRWLFLLESIITFAIGVWSWFALVPSPTQTKAPWRKNGWFTEHEEKIMVNRILRDDPSKSDMHNRQAITWKMLWESICDYDLWPIYLIGLTFSMPASPVNQYLTLTLRALGFDTFDSNLLSIPTQVWTIFNMLIFTWLSERINHRALLGVAVQIWLLPCIIALAVLPSDASRWSTYALVTVLLAYPTPHPMQVGWCSRNSNTVRTRTVSAALYNMLVQVNGIVSANIYRQDDRPEYRRGNRILTAIASYNIVLYVSVWWYYRRKNQRRETVWEGKTTEEKREYFVNTKDEGSKRLDFKFAY